MWKLDNSFVRREGEKMDPCVVSLVVLVLNVGLWKESLTPEDMQRSSSCFGARRHKKLLLC
jgi:hypothetical protein